MIPIKTAAVIIPCPGEKGVEKVMARAGYGCGVIERKCRKSKSDNVCFYSLLFESFFMSCSFAAFQPERFGSSPFWENNLLITAKCEGLLVISSVLPLTKCVIFPTGVLL